MMFTKNSILSSGLKKLDCGCHLNSVSVKSRSNTKANKAERKRRKAGRR